MRRPSSGISTSSPTTSPDCRVSSPLQRCTPLLAYLIARSRHVHRRRGPRPHLDHPSDHLLGEARLSARRTKDRPPLAGLSRAMRSGGYERRSISASSPPEMSTHRRFVPALSSTQYVPASSAQNRASVTSFPSWCRVQTPVWTVASSL